MTKELPTFFTSASGRIPSNSAYVDCKAMLIVTQCSLFLSMFRHDKTWSLEDDYKLP